MAEQLQTASLSAERGEMGMVASLECQQAYVYSTHGWATHETALCCTADTRDVKGTVEQVKRCVDAGAEIVRITVQGKREAAACMDIREALFKDK